MTFFVSQLENYTFTLILSVGNFKLIYHQRILSLTYTKYHLSFNYYTKEKEFFQQSTQKYSLSNSSALYIDTQLFN